MKKIYNRGLVFVVAIYILYDSVADLSANESVIGVKNGHHGTDTLA